MSGMQRGKRATNWTQRHRFHRSLYLSVSVCALEDGLISSALRLRFKHLCPPLPSSLPFLSASQCLPECLPSCIPPLQAMMREAVGHTVEDRCRGFFARLLDERLRWTGREPNSLRVPQSPRARQAKRNVPAWTGESPFFKSTDCATNTKSVVCSRRLSKTLSNEVKEWPWIQHSLLPLFTGLFHYRGSLLVWSDLNNVPDRALLQMNIFTFQKI